MSIASILTNTIATAVDNSNDYWVGSPFQDLIPLTNDDRGDWGEDFLSQILNQAGVENTWLGSKNINQGDGTYDIQTASGTRIEVKTATSANCWQHENIYAAPVWDYIAFVDVEFDRVTITFISHSDLSVALTPENVKHPVFNRTGTLRSAQQDKYKYDFGKKQHALGVANGYSFVYIVDNPDEEGLINYIQGLNL